MLKEEWQRSNVRLRRCTSSGIITYEEWNDENNDFHRWNDEPAAIERDRKTGKIINAHYYIHGRLHRDNGEPAAVFFTADGKATGRLWFVEGRYSRPNDLPNAELINPANGIIHTAQYRIHTGTGRRGYILHRENGPAELKFDPDTGALLEAGYYLNGRKRQPPSGPTPGL